MSTSLASDLGVQVGDQLREASDLVFQARVALATCKLVGLFGATKLTKVDMHRGVASVLKELKAAHMGEDSLHVSLRIRMKAAMLLR
jgi:hypothetical protein